MRDREQVERIRRRAGLRTDRDYSPLDRHQEFAAATRLIASDYSVWPAVDNGYRHGS